MPDPWWSNPGLRWLLIIVTALNVAGFSGRIVSTITLRLFVWPKAVVTRRLIAAFACESVALFAQSALWLTLSLSADPSVWPLLILCAVAVCGASFLLGYEAMLVYLAWRPVLEGLPDAGPSAGLSSSLRSLLRVSLRRLWVLLMSLPERFRVWLFREGGKP